MKFYPMVVVAALVFSLGAPVSQAEQGGGSGGCYNCEKFAGEWECTTWSSIGGTSCSASGASCTVSGKCSASGTTAPVEILADMVREIARQDPSVAIALARLANKRVIDSTQTMYWNDNEWTRQDVEIVLAGGTLAGASSQREVIHDIYFEQLDERTAMLVMEPNENSSIRSYHQLSVLLEKHQQRDVFETVTWILR